MDYLKKYKSFMYSHYLSSGVRITVGVVLPALILQYFNMLGAGIAVSLGAMCVSGTDNPGPIHYRRNEMLICCLLLFFVTLLTGLTSPYPILLGTLIVVCCFAFSMLGVYGNGPNSIGVASLLIMVLHIDRPYHGVEVLKEAGYILAGGTWYTLLSLLLYRFRPYKLAQQALGECIDATADYLRTRALFYDRQVNYEKAYQQMLDQQIAVHQKQDLVRELLFKSRDIVKESTPTARILVIIFVEMVDLFEKIMTSYQDYRHLHDTFENTDILVKYRQLILELARELDDIGLAIKSGRPSQQSDHLKNAIQKTREDYFAFRDRERKPENIEQFITLRQMLYNMENLADRLQTLHLYTTYNPTLVKSVPEPRDYDKFITRADMSPSLLRENLTLKSNYFRHALRVSIATIAGYIVSLFLQVGHGYWILLTIVVILKPTYSLTKKRNYERLTGTVAGALIGLLILYLIHDKSVLFGIMLFLMVGTYSFLRTNYLLSVIMMTPYVLLLLHLLDGGPINTLLFDRLADTGIGSILAFLANFFLVPVWEHERIKTYMADALTSNMAYFKQVSSPLIEQAVTVTAFKVSRKNAFVALANLSDAFNRVLSEPKNKKTNQALIHEFVVTSHMLTSHIATLSFYTGQLATKYASQEFKPVIFDIIARLENAATQLQESATDIKTNIAPISNWQVLDERVNMLMQKRRTELQQGFMETTTRQSLAEYKSMTDQFRFIAGLTNDCLKISTRLKDE